jgi:tRNA-2-methylthio-N6-dimethylallyladenosine synthase
VREKPVDKLFSEIGRYAKTKKATTKIGVCGCTASHLGEEIIKKAPVVNFVLGARNVSKITDVLHRDKAVEIDIDYDDSSYLFGDFRSHAHKALVNISIGCDKACSFCIVPHTRGDEISIPSRLILDEVKKAVDSGISEIHLLGQNVNNYARRFSQEDEIKSFTQLLNEVSHISGVKRIRFASPHPLHTDDEFLTEFAMNPKICKSLHLPLQSGSTKILKEMKRGYTKEWFLNRALKVRSLAPTATISTDIIVGFPGESDEDFEDTMDVVRQVEFEFLYSFKYSPRPHTAAALLQQDVVDEIASWRLEQLQTFHDTLRDKTSLAHLDLILDVMFEDAKEGGVLFGKSDNGFVVKSRGDASLLGKILPVTITQANRHTLTGVIQGL